MSYPHRWGMAKPYEQDVILDADGKALFSVMDILERRIGNIQKTITKIQQDSFKTVKDLNKTIDANVKALSTAQRQMNTLSNMGKTERQQQIKLAGTQARADVGKYGITSTRVGYELELEKKLQSLQSARTEKTRRAALEQVQLASARLAAVQKIEAAEERAANSQRSIARADVTSSHRARLLLARSYAEQQVATLGTERALEVAKGKQVVAEQALARATSVNRDELRRNLEVENARVRAAERLVNAQRRAAGGSGGGASVPPSGPPPVTPPPSGPGGNRRLSNILSPGYAAAAFARTAVYGAAAGLAYGAFNTVQESLSSIVNLEDELKRLQAISAATDTQMVSLKGSIYEIGASSRFSVVELAKIAQTLAQAGVSVADMSRVLQSVTRLATASGSTPDEAVQLVTSALGAFQLQGTEAARVADLMTEALNRTKLTVQQTGQAIQYVGATAYEQNISLEQLLSTIGAVAQAGVRSGSTIGTGFRQFLVDLADPSKKLSEQLKALGLSAADVDVRVRGLPAVLETLSKAGFGAAQAYEGLEVRAAAFYLVAKNNVDVMDRLQLAFAQSGAAAKANDTAMSSLAAQWQKFKNNLQDLLQGPAGRMVDFLKVVVEGLNELIDKIKEYNAERAKNGASNIGSEAFGKALGAIPGAGPILEAGWKAFNATGTQSQRVAEDLTTKISNLNDKVENQRTSLGELDKELERIIVQKESLAKNETRTAAETATLSSKFQGLAGHLTTTGNSYNDLVEAMKKYRNQQILLLNTDLLSQQAQLTLDNANARTRTLVRAKALTSDPNFFAQTGGDVAVMQALSDVSSKAPGSREFNNAQNVLVDAIARFATSNKAVADKLNEVVQETGKVAYNTQVLESIKLETQHNAAATTGFGQTVTNTVRDIQADITKMQSQVNGSKEKGALTGDANKLLNYLEKEIKSRQPLATTDQSKNFLNESLQVVASLRQQVKAMNMETDEERQAREKAEREAEKGPKMTQAELDSIALKFLGTGWRLGSGVRPAAEQNRLHALGLTPADAEHSSHSNGGLARDFPLAANVTPAQAAMIAQALRQHFKNLGVDVFVQFESGRGKNQGTGPHIHASARRGTRWKGSAAGSDQAAIDAFNEAMEDAQTGLDKREFNEALKDLNVAVGGAAQDAAIARARAAMEKVKDDLKAQAERDLAKAGIGPGMPQYAARMAQLQDELAQMGDEFNRKIGESIVKSAKATMDAAQAAFEEALQPSQRALNVAEGVVTGLGYYSNRNAPDYVTQLAQQQASRAKEAADRAKLAALPDLIGTAQNTLQGLMDRRDSGLLDSAALADVNQQILELSNNLMGLKTTRDALAAAFGAEGLLPQTLGQGLSMAATAYQELHNTGASFVEMMNNEWTGAIGAVHEGLTQMFEAMLSGSMNAGQAMLQFAKAVIAAITQIVAKIIATQIINLLLNVFGAVGGSVATSSGAYTQGNVSSSGTGVRSGGFLGGPVRRARGGPIGYVGVGHNMRDNVHAVLSKGEWVVNKRAVDSVGHEFMSDLNNRGKAAVQSTGNMPALNVNPHQEMTIWMVKPEDKPQMGPNDVLVTWQDDVLRNGQTRRIIEHVVRESK